MYPKSSNLLYNYSVCASNIRCLVNQTLKGWHNQRPIFIFLNLKGQRYKLFQNYVEKSIKNTKGFLKRPGKRPGSSLPQIDWWGHGRQEWRQNWAEQVEKGICTQYVKSHHTTQQSVCISSSQYVVVIQLHSSSRQPQWGCATSLSDVGIRRGWLWNGQTPCMAGDRCGLLYSTVGPFSRATDRIQAHGAAGYSCGGGT
jgi:hypothetical protein